VQPQGSLQAEHRTNSRYRLQLIGQVTMACAWK
jgi:hypothetical protein